MKYYIYGDETLAKRDGFNIPELYLGGVWKRFYQLETFDHDIEEISESDFKQRLIDEEKTTAY